MDIKMNALKDTFEKLPRNKEKLKNIGPYLELSAALISGVLILAGWLTAKYSLPTLSVILYLSAFVIGGFAKAREGILSTIEEKKLNVEILMILAATGSALIGYWAEGAILIFIFAVSGALETYTMSKSHKEISSLMELQPEEAWLIENGIERKVAVSELKVGDLILIKPGERVASDGKIVNGKTSIDESAITGESIPVNKGLNEEVFAGTVNGQGSITVEITKPSSETLFQKIINLVQNAQSEKSPSQQFIERFEGTYVNIVLFVVALMLFLPHYLFDWSWNETIYRAMVLLVVASPCAVVASIMPATLSAISNGARNGILFKGGIHLEMLGNLQAVAFDKTGTLTQGKPKVTDFHVINEQEADAILQTVASIEKHSNHPLAQAIVTFAEDERGLQLTDPGNIEDVTGWGIQAKIDGSNWKVGKKAFMESGSDWRELEEQARNLSEHGKTIVFIQKDDSVIGIIALKDVVRRETKEAVKQLKDLGIQTVMITGDNESTAKVIASEAGLTTFIAECLPEKKVAELKKLKKTHHTVAMVGDGINDAPALATANVGISMGEGTDVALETADVVLMKNDLRRISSAIQLSKKMNRIIKQNLFFSIAIIILLIVSNFFQAIDLPLGVIGHEGSTILVILNGLRLLKS